MTRPHRSEGTAVAARSDMGTGPLVPDMVRPTQFQRIWCGLKVRSAEQTLAAAVLEQVVEDLQDVRCASSRRRGRLYKEAYQWVASDDRAWPYSFLNICDMLSLSSDAVRGELLRHGPGDRVDAA